MAFCLCACWANALHAGEPPSQIDAMGDKLLRGAANIAYGWLEIPKNMVNEVDRGGAIYAPLGLGKGLAYMAGRLAVGVAELVSFPVPTAPLAQPPLPWHYTDTETVFAGENGWP